MSDWWIRSVGFFSLSLLGQVVLARCFPSKSRVIQYFALVAGLGAVLFAQLLFVHGISSEPLAGLLVFGSLCEFYLFLFTFAGSSISATLLRKLGARSMTEVELQSAVSSRGLVSERMDSLLKTELIVTKPGGFLMTARGLILLRRFQAFRKAFKPHDRPRT